MKKLESANLEGKRVIVRCDFNVPVENGVIKDSTRIEASIPTLKYILSKADKVIILSHLGRIKNPDDLKNNSLLPICNKLEYILGEHIAFYNYKDDIDDLIKNNKVIMFENTRFFDIDNKKESNNDKELSKYFASFGDVFINDAFGVCHREAASNSGICEFLPSYMGYLVEREIINLNNIRDNPKRPFTIILGGSKVSDKIGVISNLIDKADKLVIIGAMAFTFLKAKGIEIGKSLLDKDSIEYAKDLLLKYNSKIVLPIDVYVSKEFSNNSSKILKNTSDLDYHDMGLDIGPKSIDLIYENIKSSKTIFLNGPAGAFEFSNFSYGTKELFRIISSINANTIIGGGDSAYAAIKFGYKESFTHISTGGGASLEYLEGKELPALKYLCE